MFVKNRISSNKNKISEFTRIPSKDCLTVEYAGTDYALVAIIDNVGKCVKTANIDNKSGHTTINVENLSTGTYTVYLKINGKVIKSEILSIQ